MQKPALLRTLPFMTLKSIESRPRMNLWGKGGRRERKAFHLILSAPTPLHVFLAAAIFFLQILFLTQICTKFENRSFFYSYETFALLLGKYKCFLVARTLNHYLSLPLLSGPRREREREREGRCLREFLFPLPPSVLL